VGGEVQLHGLEFIEDELGVGIHGA
jgi:hypothetical protein